MGSPSTDESRGSTSDRRPRCKQRHKSQSRSSKVRGRSPLEETEKHQVPTREFRKWRRNADKMAARGQKETFDLFDDRFRRRFPSRHSEEGPKHHPKREPRARKERSPTDPKPMGASPKRRRPKPPIPLHSKCIKDQLSFDTINFPPTPAPQ